MKGLLGLSSETWRRAQVFVGFYQSLDKVMQGNAVAMFHWLRRHHEALGSAPFYLIVDEGRLDFFRVPAGNRSLDAFIMGSILANKSG